MWLKRCLVLALRHMALTDQIDRFGFIESLFQRDLAPLLELEDMRVLLSCLRLVPTASGANLNPLLYRLESTVDKMTENEVTTVSKFQ